MQGASVFQLKTEIESMTFIVKKMALLGKVRAYFETLIGEDLQKTVTWDRGHLEKEGRELLLLHLIQFKELPFFNVPVFTVIPDTIFVHPFYFSRYGPSSVAGIFNGIYMRIMRALNLAVKNTLFYVNWLQKRMQAKKVNSEQYSFADGITGVYKAEDGFEVSIEYTGRYLTATTRGIPVLKLLYLSNNRFLCEKFRVVKYMNVEMEFVPGKRTGEGRFNFCPANTHGMIFYKTTPSAV
jgi:hypothetical protein